MDLSLNQNSISRYENGEREADYALLIKFADYFNVSIDYLLERTDNSEMYKQLQYLAVFTEGLFYEICAELGISLTGFFNSLLSDRETIG